MVDKHLLAVCGVALALVIETGPALAQADKLEEIIVTARKRSESLQDVPVAVVAIPKSVLENNIATDLNKIGELAPQVMIGRAVSGTGSILTIRGISSGTTDSGLEQSVSLSIDGVPLSRGRIVQSAMFDMQQIEILQGPQALFFGKNSPAGVISISSADPGDAFEAELKAGYEFEAEERYGQAVISGPLTDTLGARLAFRYSEMDGWMRNVATAQPNPFQPFAPLPGATQGTKAPAGDNVFGRLTFLWQPSDDFTANLKLLKNRERFNEGTPFNEEFCTGGQSVPLILGVPQTQADCRADQVIARTAYPPLLAVNYPYANGGVPYLQSDIDFAALTLEKSFNGLSVTSTTGYYGQDHQGAYNADRSQFVQIFAVDKEDYQLFTQELRLNTDFDGPVNFMIGAYYETADRRFWNIPSILNVFDPVAQNYVTVATNSDSDNESYSAFAQIRWQILDSLELSAGARYTRDRKKSIMWNSQTNLATATGQSAYPAGQFLTARYSDNDVSPDVALTWKPDPNQTVYAAYKTGYKAGGISTPSILAGSATPTNVLFGPEEAKGFEVGYKADLFGTLRLDLTAYRYEYDGLQVTSYDSANVRFTLANAAEARTTGVTGSVHWWATDRLSLNGNVGYNRAKYVSFPNAPCFVAQSAAQGCVGGVQDLSGQALNRAPKWMFKIGGDYEAALGGGWTADLSLSAAYTSSYQSQTDYGPGGMQSSYWLVNAAVHLSPENERFRLSLMARNLDDAYYKISTNNQSLGTPNQYSATFGRPREVVFEASYRF